MTKKQLKKTSNVRALNIIYSITNWLIVLSIVLLMTAISVKFGLDWFRLPAQPLELGGFTIESVKDQHMFKMSHRGPCSYAFVNKGINYVAHHIEKCLEPVHIPRVWLPTRDEYIPATIDYSVVGRNKVRVVIILQYLPWDELYGPDFGAPGPARQHRFVKDILCDVVRVEVLNSLFKDGVKEIDSLEITVRLIVEELSGDKMCRFQNYQDFVDHHVERSVKIVSIVFGYAIFSWLFWYFLVV